MEMHLSLDATQSVSGCMWIGAGDGGMDDIVIAFRLSCPASQICLCVLTCSGSKISLKNVSRVLGGNWREYG